MDMLRVQTLTGGPEMTTAGSLQKKEYISFVIFLNIQYNTMRKCVTIRFRKVIEITCTVVMIHALFSCYNLICFVYDFRPLKPLK